MVEVGELQAWKTSGGHRRVSVRSVEANLRKRGPRETERTAGARDLAVLIAEDDRSLQLLYRETIGSWKLPVCAEIVGNGIDGLVKIGLHIPDVLIVDLLLPGIDGFEMIRRLRANPELGSMDVIVVTGMEPEQIEARGGLPASVTIYGKPVPFQELRGYLQAKIVQRNRDLQLLART
jgi:CheY-like chemotaxis protein